jgi:hypothetical protein
LWLCTIFSGKATARYASISASRSDLSYIPCLQIEPQSYRKEVLFHYDQQLHLKRFSILFASDLKYQSAVILGRVLFSVSFLFNSVIDLLLQNCCYMFEI